MPDTVSYNVSDYADRLEPGELIRIEHRVSTPNPEIAGLVSHTAKELEKLHLESANKERVIFNKLRGAFEAVSYTHLDVYKRQLLKSNSKQFLKKVMLMYQMLLSINPEHVESILCGKKQFEFRKVRCKEAVSYTHLPHHINKPPGYFRTHKTVLLSVCDCKKRIL